MSPNGRTIASGAEDRTIRLWEARTGRQLAALQGHQALIYNLAFSPDGRTLASASRDRTVRLWQVGAESQALRAHQAGVNGVAFSPDGKAIASASSDKTVRLWDTTTGRPSTVLHGHEATLYGVAGVTKVPIERILKGIIPFFIVVMFMLILLIFFPALSTWLPDTMFSPIF